MSVCNRDDASSKRSVLIELPVDIYAMLATRAHGNDRSVKAEAERIVRLTIVADVASDQCAQG